MIRIREMVNIFTKTMKLNIYCSNNRRTFQILVSSLQTNIKKIRANHCFNLLDLLSEKQWEDAIATHLSSQFTWVAQACDSTIHQPSLLHWFLFELCATSDSAWSLYVSWIYYCLTSSSCTKTQLISCTTSTAALAALAGFLAHQYHANAGITSLYRDGGRFSIILLLSSYFISTHLPAKCYSFQTMLIDYNKREEITNL